MYTINDTKLCTCGALTIELLDENMNSVTVNYNGSIREFIEEYRYYVSSCYEWSYYDFYNNKYIKCNYCGNKQGLDLCSCGSGERVDECKRGYDCCNIPSQSL